MNSEHIPNGQVSDELFAVQMNGNWSIAKRVSASAYGADTGEQVWSEQGTTAWVGLVGEEDCAIALTRRSSAGVKVETKTEAQPIHALPMPEYHYQVDPVASASGIHPSPSVPPQGETSDE